MYVNMRIVIDTKNKTLELMDNVPVKELIKWIEENKLIDYNIKPYYYNSLSYGTFTPNIIQPLKIDCVSNLADTNQSIYKGHVNDFGGR